MADAAPQLSRRPRPLSPHLSIYRRLNNMVMSILHRITGVALYFGTLLLAWWLIAAATNATAFATVSGFLGSIPGRLILFGFTWALLHHMLGGLRHFVWDMGIAMDHPQREYLAQATLIGGMVLTILVWIAAYMAR